MQRALIVLCLLLLVLSLPCRALPEGAVDLGSKSGQVWRLLSAKQAEALKGSLHEPGLDTRAWVPGLVPGTVFTAHVAAGVEKDPNFADHIHQVETARYDQDFWYRTELKAAAPKAGRRLWLNFLGVNRDAEVFLNGKRLGEVRGIVQRGLFDLTGLLQPSANVLAVLVKAPRMPISNGAAPTYGSSGGWDWMPRVPGLNAGIQDEVYLRETGPVTLQDPWIRAELPSLDLAELRLETLLANHSDREVEGVLEGEILPEGLHFRLHQKVPAGGTKPVVIDAQAFPELRLKNPRLWWPNGYGKPELYEVRVRFVEQSGCSDEKRLPLGIRRLEIDFSNKAMRVVVNGVPIFAKGGNWGMPEYLLRCSPEDYALKVALHRDMNFTMIRNWMGSTTHEAFYEACDRNGILVWDDFWLNSSGGLPRDEIVFHANVVEKLKRLRNHPCIAFWCGCNEGVPGDPLNDWIAASVKTYDGRHYHPNSHSDHLSGSGPWTGLDPEDYFLRAAPGNWGGDEGWGLRGEIGTAVFVNVDSLRKFLPADKLWPRNELWDKHYFGPSAMYAGPDRYEQEIHRRFGAPTDLEDFCRKAQLLNLETIRAMFEGWQDNLWNDASGLLLWMSQSAYPSLVWQTYDYYHDATGAYWGAKLACEPLHIQWNCGNGRVKVVNTSVTEHTGLKAEARLYRLDGTEIQGQALEARVDVPANQAVPCFTLDAQSGDLARAGVATVSSVHVPSREGDKLLDGRAETRWESDFSPQAWACIDLGTPSRFDKVILRWEEARAKCHKIQGSNDGKTWTDLYYQPDCRGGVEEIPLPGSVARYVRMYCIEKATTYGISLNAFEVHGTLPPPRPQETHFLRLRLSDTSGRVLSENLYWRGKDRANSLACPELATLPKTRLLVTQGPCVETKGQVHLPYEISNPSDAPAAAFALRVQVIDSRSGERVLPIYLDENYFTLMRGEKKKGLLHFKGDADLAKHAILKISGMNTEY